MSSAVLQIINQFMCIFKSLYGSCFPPHKTVQQKVLKKPQKNQKTRPCPTPPYNIKDLTFRLWRKTYVELEGGNIEYLPLLFTINLRYLWKKKEQTRNRQRNTYFAHLLCLVPSKYRFLFKVTKPTFTTPSNCVCLSVSHTLLCPFFIHCQMSSVLQDVFLFWNQTSFLVLLLCIFRGLSSQKKKNITDEVITFY